MVEDYFSLDQDAKRELLLAASGELGRAAALLEKDIWVVRTLGWLFDSPWRDHLVFKGGTSLSKVYGLIDRFSEDIDVTYDIRELLPALRGAAPDPLPPSASQAKRWSDQAREALAVWVEGEVAPTLRKAFGGLGAAVSHEAADINVSYPSALDESPGYLRSGVTVEFGGRATGEPTDSAKVRCDAAEVERLAAWLPDAEVRVMRAERTFWEKATAAHVFCLQERLPTERFARHWFDLACMGRAGTATTALADRSLGNKVADHKTMFFRTKAADSSLVDYAAAVNGGLCLVPSASAAERLRADYDAMVEGGFLGSWQPPFDEVLVLCTEIEAEANAFGVNSGP